MVRSDQPLTYTRVTYAKLVHVVRKLLSITDSLFPMSMVTDVTIGSHGAHFDTIAQIAALPDK